MLFLWGVPLVCGLVFSLPELVVSTVFFQELSEQIPVSGEGTRTPASGNGNLHHSGKEENPAKKTRIFFWFDSTVTERVFGEFLYYFSGFSGVDHDQIHFRLVERRF